MSSGEPRPQTESPGLLSGVLAYLGRSYITVGMLTVGVGLIVAILITLSGFGGTASKDADVGKKADSIDEARRQLEHDADVGACRAALQQINVALSSRPDDRPASIDPQTLKRLTQDLKLDEDDGAEVAADSYTVLDGQHLAGAFLFRDAAAHALEPQLLGADVPPQARPTPLERATAAFEWAVREVRLAPPTLVNRMPTAAFNPTPPQYVLRRGSGTPLERALVFLELLDQVNAAGPPPLRVAGVDKTNKEIAVKDDSGRAQTIPVDEARVSVDGAAGKGIDDLKEDMWVAAESDGGKTTVIDAWSAAPPPALLGCLVFCDGREAPAHPWACGVMVYGKPDVYLFDPLLGLPIPGEGGVGVATLADAARKPELLRQLQQIEGAPPYDVTAKQAAGARLQLVYSLSAVAPRMRHLQEKVLPPVRVSLYHDPDRETPLWRDAAAKASGGAPTLWADGPTLLRRFLPPEEGGTDKGSPFALRDLKGFTDRNDQNVAPQMQRLTLYQLELAPWDAMPPTFRDPDKFPYNVGLGLRVREFFQAPFRRLLLEPQGPRDLLLRGDFEKAAGDLIGQRAHMEQEQRRIADERKLLADSTPPQTLEGKVDESSEQLVAAYAEQLRKQEDGTPAERAEADKDVEKVWNDATSVRILLQGASSVPGAAEVTYQLGLCKHDKAERAQARLAVLRRQRGADVAGAEIEDVNTAWMDAVGWWNKYADDHPEEDANRPSTSPGRAAAVRRMRARAQAMLGDWKAAAATCEDRREPPLEPLEQLAALYQARQLRKAHAADK